MASSLWILSTGLSLDCVVAKSYTWALCRAWATVRHTRYREGKVRPNGDLVLRKESTC
jgi:hypothetical protein